MSSLNTKLVFSSLIVHKDKNDVARKVDKTTKRLQLKNNDFIDNSNIGEGHLESNKLQLKKKLTFL